MLPPGWHWQANWWAWREVGLRWVYEECAFAKASLETCVSLRCSNSEEGNWVGDIEEGVADKLEARWREVQRIGNLYSERGNWVEEFGSEGKDRRFGRCRAGVIVS